MNGWPRRPIRFACSVAACLLARPRALPAQQPVGGAQDEALVGVVARLLAAADARRFDEGALRDALQNPNPGVRRQAALAAARVGSPAGVDLLLDALNDSSEGVRAAAAFGLGILRAGPAVDPLANLIQRTPAESVGPAYLESITALARIGGDVAARTLTGLIDAAAAGQGGPGAGQAALESWRLGGGGACPPRPLAAHPPIPSLIRLSSAQNDIIRTDALYALARLRRPDALQAILVALQDQSPFVRAVAARGVTAALVDSAHLGRRGVETRLAALLDDADRGVRINVLRALASFRDSGVGDAVAPLAGDPDVGIAAVAETTLGVSGGAAAIAALRTRVTSAAFPVRRAALIGLAQADSVAGVAAADSAARDPDWRWRSVAAEAYAGAGDRGRLEGLLADRDGRVVAMALQGLETMVPAADTALAARARGLLAHADPAVRSVAADVLARHPDPADVPALVAAYRRAAGDPFDDARLSAVSALAAISASGAAGRLAVASGFLAAVPTPDDYLVRRLAAARFPDALEQWGPPGPIATGRTDADYRDIARRYVVPVLLGQPAPTVTIETDGAAITVTLLPLEAPITVAAFLGLVDRRYFDGDRWHRVVANFVLQDGDPRGDGWGGPGFTLRDEIGPTHYQAGTVGLALSGPDTGGSQFFITVDAEPHLDGVYPVFGRVTSDIRVLATVAQGDLIRSIHR